MVNRSRAQSLDPLIIPCMFDRRTRAAIESLSYLRETYAESLWSDVIPVDTQFREASKRGVPISHMQPSSRGAQAYLRLLAELDEDPRIGAEMREEASA
jgi:chromosome partitioning protein